MIFVVIGIIVLFVIRKKLKVLKIPCVFFIDGAPKTGKSALSLSLAHKRYLGNVVKWHLGKPFYFLRYRTLKDYPLKPMFYSNIPLGFKHNRITKDMLMLKVKVPKKSVFFIDEASLVADSMMFKDEDMNLRLLMFFKLIGHTTYGGSVYMNITDTLRVHVYTSSISGMTNKFKEH